MMLALLCGAAAGTGLLAIAWALVPPRANLAGAVSHLDEARLRSGRTTMTATHRRRDRLGAQLRSGLARRGIHLRNLTTDLALCNRTIEEHLVRKLIAAGIGLVLPTVALLLLATAGIGVGWALSTVTALVFAAVLFWVPDLDAHREAQRRRKEMRRALSCYLQLVAMALAGGRGIPEALPSAARVGTGWAFELIADTITAARYTGRSPWDALTELGDDTGVPELSELGKAAGLVSGDGAKITDSLQARAATARARELAEAEGLAERKSSSMQHAQLILGFGFLAFIMYPAVIAVMSV